MKEHVANDNTPLLLRLDEVCRLVSLSPATIFRAVKAGRFPAPMRIDVVGRGGVCSRWSRQAVLNWVHSHVQSQQDACSEGPSVDVA